MMLNSVTKLLKELNIDGNGSFYIHPPEEKAM